MKSKFLLLIFIAFSLITFGQSDRYWSGGSGSSDNIDQSTNWYGGTNPSAGDNLYFNNTITRHWAYSNYGSGSWFGNFITYSGAGGIKLYGDNTYANKFENFSDPLLLELSPSSATIGSREIGNRLNNDLEINPVGTGGILVSCDKISIDNSGGARTLKVYGNNALTINGYIEERNGSGAKLNIYQNAYVTIKGSSTISGATTISAGTLELQGSLANSDVTVASGATLRINGTNVTVKSLTVNAGGNVEIEPGKSLTVTGALANSGTLRINSDATGTGSLITNGTVSGNATIERYIGAWGTAAQGWHFLSSPVAGQSFQNEFVPDPPTVNEDFYLWDEPGSQWVNSKSGSDPFTFNVGAFGTTFVTGKGYLVSYASNFTKNFVGVPNTSSVSDIALTYTPASAAKGWNLLGNPFPSALTWNIETWKPGNLTISGTAKIVKSADASYEDITAGEVIPAMNGFFVYTSASTTLTIPAGSRTHGSDWFKQTSTLSKLILKVIDLDGQTAQKTQLILNPESTSGYDFLYDSEFLPFLAPSLYTLVEGKQLSTNSIPAITGNMVVPVHFVKNNGSNFVIEAENVDVFGTEVNLVDNKTGQITNLNQNPAYSFTAENGDDPARFDLHFGVVNLPEQTQTTQLKAFVSNDRLYFPLMGDATLEVIDLQGRKLSQTKMSGTGLTSHPMSLTAGAYIVRLQSETGILTAKVIVK